MTIDDVDITRIPEEILALGYFLLIKPQGAEVVGGTADVLDERTVHQARIGIHVTVDTRSIDTLVAREMIYSLVAADCHGEEEGVA